MLSADGSTLFIDKDAILERWADYFNSVLYRPSTVNDTAINILSQLKCNVLLDEFPKVTETRKAIKYLSSAKAPGADAIPAEIIKLVDYKWQINRVDTMYMKEEGYPTRIQGYIHNPSIQSERKSSSL